MGQPEPTSATSASPAGQGLFKSLKHNAPAKRQCPRPSFSKASRCPPNSTNPFAFFLAQILWGSGGEAPGRSTPKAAKPKQENAHVLCILGLADPGRYRGVSVREMGLHAPRRPAGDHHR